MLNNLVRAKLRAGETVLGCFFRWAEPTLAEYVAMQGFDFLVFDAEHGSLQPRDVEGLCRAAELRGITPIVRATTNEPSTILRFMDTGAHGVHVPWVNTSADVERAVSSVKYEPMGHRGLAGSRASDFGHIEPLADYTTRANRETMVVIHIETMQAVEAVEAYVAIEGVDVLFIGPTDLSHSLGQPGNPSHPDVAAAMERIATAVVPSDKVLGIHAGSAEMARAWRDRGARYITTGMESFLARGMADYLAALRRQ